MYMFIIYYWKTWIETYMPHMILLYQTSLFIINKIIT